MSDWKNAFDDGPCMVTATTIDLNSGDRGTILTQAMDKGESVSVSPFTLSVDAAGRVTLSAEDQYYGGYEFAVDVAPADMTGVTAGRIVDVVSGGDRGTYARRDGADQIELNQGEV